MSDRVSLERYLELVTQKLLARFPFFGILLVPMRLVPSEQHPTAATDGRAIFYNPDWLESLRKTDEHVLYVLAHEVCHPALGHLWRVGSRDRLKWNICCDLVVNDILDACGLSGPSGTLRFGDTFCGVYMDPAWRGLSEEEIYELMPDPPGKAASPALGGDILDPARDGQAKDSPGNLRDVWRDRLVRAAHAARCRGSVPLGIERVIDGVLRPRKNWRTVLAEFVQPVKHDYDWRRPDRRLLPDLYLPTIAGEGLEDLVVGVDTSGSTWNEQETFLAEVEGILRSYPYVSVWVMTCDAKVHQVWHADQDTPILRRLAGGGGTSFVPVFDRIRELGINPTGVVFLTDGDGEYPDREPPYPVLWVLTARHHVTPPWGRVTVLDREV